MRNIRDSQIGCHFCFERMAVLVAVRLNSGGKSRLRSAIQSVRLSTADCRSNHLLRTASGCGSRSTVPLRLGKYLSAARKEIPIRFIVKGSVADCQDGSGTLPEATLGHLFQHFSLD